MPIAAVLLAAFLALANLEIRWNKEGLSFKTHLSRWGASQSDYYTKAEVRDILKRVMDDSESRVTETNYLMIQELLNTIEQDRMMDLRLVRQQAATSRGKN